MENTQNNKNYQKNQLDTNQNGHTQPPLNTFQLQIYYDRVFPFNTIYNWLSKNCEEVKQNREFAFIKNDGTFVRYQSFENAREMKIAAVKKMPIRIEIGPIYSTKPSEREMAFEFKAVQKEFVFDIDISDYNDIRTCCNENQICKKCWDFMSCAIKVIECSLKDDFGFKNILWVFSGRRGIHCWVSDTRARKMDNATRSSIVRFLTIFDKRAVKDRAEFLNPPFSIKRAYFYCRQYFLRLLESQNWLFDAKSVDRVLKSIPKEFSALKTQLRENWVENGDLTPTEKFGMIEDYLRNDKKFSGYKIYLRNKLRAAIKDIILSHTYPRLDIEVSRKVNHLLKSPFVVHPKTAKICVPIRTRWKNGERKILNEFSGVKEEPWAVDQFPLENLPTLQSVNLAINSSELNEKSNKSEKNTIFDFIQFFEETVNKFD